MYQKMYYIIIYCPKIWKYKVDLPKRCKQNVMKKDLYTFSEYKHRNYLSCKIALKICVQKSTKFDIKA